MEKSLVISMRYSNSIEIRDLNLNEFHKAIEIKYNCWIYDYSFFLKVRDDFKLYFLNELTEWMTNIVDDVRVFKGAFIDNVLSGFIGASFAEKEDSKHGVEINYLFVDPSYRNQGISLLLLDDIVNDFSKLGCKDVVIYNFKKSNSNSFYKHLKGKLMRTDIQEIPDNDIQEICVFSWDIVDLSNLLKKKILKRREGKYV